MGAAELSYQNKMLNILEEKYGGIGFKIESPWKAGYPDLCVAAPNQSTVLIEVKFGILELRELQKRTVRRLLAGGMDVEAIAIYVEGRTEWAILFEYDTGEEHHRVPLRDWPTLIWEDIIPKTT